MDAEAHAYIYASAVADLYGADSTSVVVTFAAGRRRLQSSDDVEVGYHVLYPSADEAAAAAAAAASHTAADFDGAVQSAAADAGVADVFAAASVEDVGTPAAATAGLDCYYLNWAGDGYCDEQNNVESCKYDKGDCCASTCVSTATTTCGESGYDCVDPEVLALWSGCGWIESNSNTDGEQSVGQVSSPSECIAKVLDECPGFEIANLPANGVGECFCQQGGSPVPDSSGYLCGNQPVCRVHDSSSLSHLSAMMRPRWLH